jgi:hypothetical protein
MTSADLTKIKEGVLNSVKQNFNNEGKLLSCAIIISLDGKMNVIGMPFTTQEEKIWMLDEVKKFCVKLNAVSLFIISEAWKKKFDKQSSEIADYKSGKKRVSDSDDKEECVIITYETKLISETISFEIDRSNNELINMDSGTSGGGNFSNILCDVVNLN